MQHADIRGAPYHPQTQGKIERWYQTLKNRILLENYYLPSALEAKVVGTDSKTDLALLKVEGKDFPFVQLAPEALRVGQWVLALGNPFGLGGTVAAGIVSARA